jgi:hypothetical protein
MASGALPLGVLLALLCVGVVRAADTVAVGRPLTLGQTLVSPGRKFAMGFFQPGESTMHICMTLLDRVCSV